jgi:phosphatidylinositol alpha-1,6-mannosyltransferase
LTSGAKPRLLLLTPDYPPPPGGIQLVSERLAHGLDAFDTRVLALRGQSREPLEDDRPPTRRIGAARLPHPARVALLDSAGALEALRWRPHVALSMHAVTAPAALASRLAGGRTAQYFHAEEIGARPRLARFAADRADLAIAVSRYTADLVAATGARRRPVVIPNGVDLPREWSPLPCERPTVVTVARMQERYKGHDVLVRALALVRAKVPTVQWVVIGDGPLRSSIEQMARSYGVWEACRFLGRVSDAERDEWLRRAHLFAMPSRLPARGQAGEGFGIAYMEAAAYGKPVVAGAVGGALDSVVHGETGLLIDPQDPLLVAEAIAAVLLDEELATRLGASGRAHAERHTWGAVSARVQEALLGLLGGRGGER